MMRIVELFENERYQPTVGFSSKGLLMTDRSAFSSMDGRSGWNCTYDASLALISFGWKWDELSDWNVDKSFANTDADGWSYNTSFSAFCESPGGGNGGGGSATKGIMHFVRRRRLIRGQVFASGHSKPNPDATSRRCNNCDSQQIDRISSVLVQALASASIHTFGPANNAVSESQCNLLKDRMMHALLAPLPAEYAEAAAAGRGTDRGPGKGRLMSIPQIIDHRLQRFAERKHRTDNSVDQPAERGSFFKRLGGGGGGAGEDEEDTSHILLAPGAEAAARSGSTGGAAAAAVVSRLQSVRAGLSSLVMGDSPMDAIVIRMNELSERYFPRAERAELARVALCQLDVFGEYHCRVVVPVSRPGSGAASPRGDKPDEAETEAQAEAEAGTESESAAAASETEAEAEDVRLRDVELPAGSAAAHNETCPFREECCPNEGCAEIHSRRWLPHHDASCTFKVVPCARACGECCPRRAMGLHLDSTCGLRPAECCFKELGCTVEHVAVRDLTTHMEDAAQQHLLLLMVRVKEQQRVIIGLHKQLGEANERLGRQELQVRANTAGVAAGVVAQAAQAENLNAVENKLDKKIRDTGNYISSDVTSLRKFITDAMAKQMQMQMQGQGQQQPTAGQAQPGPQQQQQQQQQQR